MPSLFVRELSRDLYTEMRETFSGALAPAGQAGSAAGMGAGTAEGSPETFRGSPDFDSFHSARREALAEARLAEESVSPFASSAGAGSGGPLGFCQHRIFGRGKVVARLGDGKSRVNFPGFGMKVILDEYLEMEP
jgi:DNA helicase-2/ATP-dependent DNA helicase PcrA